MRTETVNMEQQAETGHEVYMYDERRSARMKRIVLILMLLSAALFITADYAGAVRIKDIATFGGVRSNELVGYGLVVGLSGTGDSNKSEFTIRSLVNMLDKMGVGVDAKNLKPKNVAAVMVTTKMPVSAKPGSRLDVTVSSIGDSSSLLGGVLLLTPLKGIDGKVYAITQGSMTIGGYSAEGEAASARKNVTTVARIPNGAVVERGVPFKFNTQESLKLHLDIADFTTTNRIVTVINNSMGGKFAKADDISTISLRIPEQFKGDLVPFMASLENLEVDPESRARVAVDEKTGTVVLGKNVRLPKVAVAHGNLQVVVRESANVVQPDALSGGQTAVVPETSVGMEEENKNLNLIEGATLEELVEGLNAIGATPRDLISILRALKSAGALHADLEVY